MKLDFKKYLSEYSLPGDYAGAVHGTTTSTMPYQSPNIWTGDSNGEVPQHDIGLPQVTRRGKVVGIRHGAGGHTEITLDDRTVLRMTQGEFRRIGGDPVQPGATLTVHFQRNAGDGSQVASIVTKATCVGMPEVRTQSFNAT